MSGPVDGPRPAAPGSSHRRRLVHVFATFGVGGPQVRMSNVMNHFGRRYRHTILATNGEYGCTSHLAEHVEAHVLPLLVEKARPLKNLVRIRAILRDIRPDLLLTYNWGAIDWALVNRWFPLCRHVHLESGFNSDEVDSQRWRRVLFRRLVLSRTARVIVPSRSLENLATTVWRQRPEKVVYIPNGIDCNQFELPPERGIIPGFDKVPGELVIGTLASLRPVKNIPRLIQAFSALAGRFNARLLIMGDGLERSSLEVLARETGVANRVVFAGHVERPERVLGWLDVFAISSDTEQMPNSVLQAMAAGRPIVGVDVGDIKLMVSPENRPFIVPKGDEERFQLALDRLLAGPEIREELGRHNHAHVRAHYSQERMFRAYQAVFDG